MTERVNIFIEGIQLGEEEARIITHTKGEYCRSDDGHILRYCESGRDGEADSDNTIKISPKLVEMIKNGENSTHMVFDIAKFTHSIYDTQYGSLQFQINTTKINLQEDDEELILHMEYSLSHSGNHISDNRIKIIAKN